MWGAQEKSGGHIKKISAPALCPPLANCFRRHCKTLYNNFIDFKQAFDSVRHFGILDELVRILENLCNKFLSAVRVDSELTNWFGTTVGVRQGFVSLHTS